MIAGTLASAGGSDAVGVIFGGVSAAGAGIGFAAGSGFGVSGAGVVFGGSSGLISIFACCANVSEAGGAIWLDGCDAGG